MTARPDGLIKKKIIMFPRSTKKIQTESKECVAETRTIGLPNPFHPEWFESSKKPQKISEIGEVSVLKSDPTPKLKIQQFNVDIASGLVTGVFCAGLFNPWDRALYLTMKHDRPFLSVENFTAPYHGFSQSIMHRAFLGSVYFIIQSQIKMHIYPDLQHKLGLNAPTSQFLMGTMVGSLSGVLTNSASSIKYHTWGHESRSFFSSIREMKSLGGFKPFIKGTSATVKRDMVFGGTYEFMRNLLRSKMPALSDEATSIEEKNKLKFLCDVTSAGVATLTSGPLNYARNIQYATPPDVKSSTTLKILRDVWRESKKYNDEPLGVARFFQKRFRMGWGTLRVATGVAVGQKLFDFTKDKLIETYVEDKGITSKRKI